MFCLCALLGVLRCHIFKSLSHFEFIFVCSVSSNFVNLHATVQLSQDCLQRACLFPIVDSLFLWWRLVAQRCVGLFLGSLFCSRDPHVCFCASTMLFWLRWLSSLGGLCLHLSYNIKVLMPLELPWTKLKMHLSVVDPFLSGICWKVIHI